MTDEELKRLLDDALTYEVYSDSLKDLNDDVNLNDLTERVMSLRININKITHKGARMCMMLRYINGYSFTEVAKRMKMSYQWINKLHTKGMEELLNIYNQG